MFLRPTLCGRRTSPPITRVSWLSSFWLMRLAEDSFYVCCVFVFSIELFRVSANDDTMCFECGLMSRWPTETPRPKPTFFFGCALFDDTSRSFDSTMIAVSTLSSWPAFLTSHTPLLTFPLMWLSGKFCLSLLLGDLCFYWIWIFAEWGFSINLIVSILSRVDPPITLTLLPPCTALIVRFLLRGRVETSASSCLTVSNRLSANSSITAMFRT